MSSEEAIEVLATVQLAVMGASHLLRAMVWVEFFTVLRERGRPGVYCIAFLSLWFGSLIVAFHPVYTGLAGVLTVFGWAQVVKGAVYFLFPDYALRKLIVAVRPDRAWMYQVWGVIFLVFAALLGWSLWR